MDVRFARSSLLLRMMLLRGTRVIRDQAETDDFDSAPLAPPPKAPWNGQSSASWIVDSPRTRRFLLIRAIIYCLPCSTKERDTRITRGRS